MNGTLLHGLGHLGVPFLGSVGLAAIFDSQAAIEPKVFFILPEPAGTRQNEATFCNRWP
jgi:hypothetical protein